MADKAKLRADLIRWYWTYEETLSDEDLDSGELEEFEQRLKRLGCEFAGHQPERDQCNIPAHDFCFWCGTSMPDSWRPPGKDLGHDPEG